jgi:hypothetical protein
MTGQTTRPGNPTPRPERPAPRERREPTGVCRWCGVLVLPEASVLRPDGTRRHLGCQ